MKQDGVGRAMAWMATGAAVLAAGAFLGASNSRRRERPAGAPDSGPKPRSPEEPPDLEDRPVAQAAWADAMAAARRVDQIAHSVSGIESRVATMETNTRQADEVWQRILRIEQMLDEIKQTPLEPAQVQALAAETERRVIPRVAALESRLDQHDVAIQQLQGHATQTDANIQRMIAAVEKLTEQISRALPAAPLRIEPKREATASPQESPESEGPAAEQRGGGLSRWRSVALIGTLTVGLAGSYAAARQVQWPARAPAADALRSAPPDRLLETAIGSFTALIEKDPQNLSWRYELGRLNELKGSRREAERWYRSILEFDPHDPRAVAALADLSSPTIGSR